MVEQVSKSDDLTLEDVHGKMRAYLTGVLSLGDFIDWIGDESWNSHRHATTEQVGPNQFRVTAWDSPAYELLADLSLMDCEMTCSGSYRTEEMFREDLQSILDGRKPTAFWGPVMDKLVSENYPQWCAQREKDIARLIRPAAWQRLKRWLGLSS